MRDKCTAPLLRWEVGQAALRRRRHRRPLPLPAGCRQDRRQTLTVAAAPGCSAEGALEPAAGSLQRRQLLSAALLPPAAAALQALAPGVAAAAEAEAPAAAPAVAPSGATYYDEEDKFSIAVPAGWERGEGALGEAGTLTSQQARFSNSAGVSAGCVEAPVGGTLTVPPAFGLALPNVCLSAAPYTSAAPPAPPCSCAAWLHSSRRGTPRCLWR